ncbi:MAG: type IV pili twitching motility protein PilT [Candidatus Niyogibacteria bacterium RIFCSPLOWO2_12_FULL_41_13]|uniref:Type IV pili twitching motility protein PilT n=1 Tax=Candidatus Niyogibacteria bacterium RIFCSPLOWO2_12_FULL_41_13 TaxID=1801726 RepID=A0A1G2F4Z0_9BACT|nr:MAG: type IV pili twitching motility protein PilT [Candidatus Niyogibacteria bacterium RIFCSPLOWO2_12_FULL_41_13]
MIKDHQQELKNLMQTVAKEGASDLHFAVSRNPFVRIAGELMPLVKEPILTPEDIENFAKLILGEKKFEKLANEKEIDFSYAFEDKLRFRGNIFYQQGFLGIALRVIPAKIPSLKELNLPEVLAEFCGKKQGFFLVVGPTGHGKSTTLASMIEVINRSRREHIVTIEDPIEYIFTSDKSIINQRQAGEDTQDFHRALRSMFREDVNVVMIGEMRDHETMATAVTAAETGHLVLSSLHTNNASQTIDRIIDSFPPSQQDQIRNQLSGTLLGVFSQRLVPRASGGRIPAYELLIANNAVRNLIRENKTFEIDMVIETGSNAGMVALNQSLSDLVKKGEISFEDALHYSLDQRGLTSLMER